LSRKVSISLIFMVFCSIETTIPSYLMARPSRDLIVAGHQQLTLEWWEKRRNDFSCPIICAPEELMEE